MYCCNEEAESVYFQHSSRQLLLLVLYLLISAKHLPELWHLFGGNAHVTCELTVSVQHARYCLWLHISHTQLILKTCFWYPWPYDQEVCMVDGPFDDQ